VSYTLPILNAVPRAPRLRREHQDEEARHQDGPHCGRPLRALLAPDPRDPLAEGAQNVQHDARAHQSTGHLADFCLQQLVRQSDSIRISLGAFQVISRLGHEDSVCLSVCKVHIPATRWVFYT
jgi:hypothetical protein